ncbi:anti-sigma regulatory factor [Spongiactinospora sp. TRM90649]|uniref:anti-sigma regulatory factor n=1 Tax=Spongiactinospora sp. TRM90649 TaxID=3031114 RepID=UPI0023F9154F|nr:anti-sigma regulatory factor [Spongiactinospora sp. TRM90649]MDF5755763.1 anti-sigma regulatory factor [Spongiactinospora sp. TRM90649]
MTGPTDVPIVENGDVVLVRQRVREAALDLGLSLVDQTKVVTAASELARNALVYAGGGRMRLHVVDEGRRRGIRLEFSDDGPGIPDIGKALTEGWSSGRGLGLGLTGSRRLMDDFDLVSTPGKGTVVTVTKWAR